MNRSLLIVVTFILSLSASFGNGEWLYYKHYPWVYDNVSKDWLYLSGNDGKVIAYRSSTSEWEDFTVPDTSLPSTLQITLLDSVVLDLILVPAGTFTMGQEGWDEEPHQVKISKPFYLGKYEVTESQYTAVINNYVSTSQLPVTRTYDLTKEFISKLNNYQLESKFDDWDFKLPTDAQWEYACRAGTTTAYSTGGSISSNDANFGTYLNAKAKDVGTYPPNNWGFYDMHGNIYEWTSTYYPLHYDGSYTVDPQGPDSGVQAYIRGGSYKSYDKFLVASNYRTHHYVDNRNYYGFRVSLQQN